MATDKTGAPTTVTKESDHFAIAVERQRVGTLEFVERDGQRVFTHTKVDENFEGRGLGTILIGEALDATRAEGLRIVPECPMVANYVKKHEEFADLVDAPNT